MPCGLRRGPGTPRPQRCARGQRGGGRGARGVGGRAVAVLVCTRPCVSVCGTRCTRCTPLSYFSLLYTASPLTCAAGASG